MQKLKVCLVAPLTVHARSSVPVNRQLLHILSLAGHSDSNLTSVELTNYTQVQSLHWCDRLLLCLQVEFSGENSTFHLLVDGVHVTDELLPKNEGSSLDLHNPVYLGGDPTGKNTKVCKTPLIDSVS